MENVSIHDQWQDLDYGPAEPCKLGASQLRELDRYLAAYQEHEFLPARTPAQYALARLAGARLLEWMQRLRGQYSLGSESKAKRALHQRLARWELENACLDCDEPMSLGFWAGCLGIPPRRLHQTLLEWVEQGFPMNGASFYTRSLERKGQCQ